MVSMGKAMRLMLAALLALALVGVLSAPSATASSLAEQAADPRPTEGGEESSREAAAARPEESSAASSSEEDPDKESEETDRDDEDGNAVAAQKQGGSTSGGNEDIKKVEQQGEDEALKKAVQGKADCSQKRVNSTCGPETNLCTSVGKCQEGAFTCEGKFRTVLASCICPDSRRGARCERAAVTTHQYNCQLNNACGGRGTCVKLRTETTDAGFTIHHGCACDEGYGGAGCHFRTGVAIGETVAGDLVKAVPNNGGYFAFLEMFRERLTGARRR